MSLEEEAKRFKEMKPERENFRNTGAERTALRFYAGQAMSGLINSGIRLQDEVIHQAFDWGFKMVEKEKQELERYKKEDK